MINRVKKILGIEGVKVDCAFDAQTDLKNNIVSGTLEITSVSDRVIKKISMIVTETYARGRGDYRRINDYVIGELILDKKIKIAPNELVHIPFKIETTLLKSQMDQMQEDGFLLKPIIRVAKWYRKVKSNYTLVVTVDEKGTKLKSKSVFELE